MNILCGKYREGHFLGVFKIVKKLFEIIRPSVAYFGKKDYQQLIMINHIVKEYFKNKYNYLPVIQYAKNNGLAMSSRNNRINIITKEILHHLYIKN